MKLRLAPEHLFAVALLSCLFAFVSTHPIRPQDYWWHLAAGQQIVTSGHIPTTDVYSYTAPGAAYPSYQVYWLAEALLHLGYAGGGPELNTLFHSLLITATYGLLLLLCWRVSGNGRLAVVCTLVAVALGIDNWNLRPQALAYFFGVVYLWLIYRERRGECGHYSIALFPLIMIAWANCHGSFPLGLVLVAMWAIEGIVQYRRDRELPFGSAALPLVVLATGLAALWFTPMHFGIISYLRELSAHPVVRALPEWAPASFATKDGIVFFIALPLSLTALIIGRRQLTVFHVLSFILFALLALTTGRAIIWFGLALAPILAETLGPMVTVTERPVSKADRVVLPALVGVFLLLMVVTLPWFKAHLPLSPQKQPLLSLETPVNSTQWLLDHNPPPRLFHHMSYGSYLIYAAYPRYQVFVDPRIELYPPEIWAEYDRLSRAQPGWQELVKRYSINTMMLETRDQAALLQAALASGEWQEAARFGATAILVKRE